MKQLIWDLPTRVFHWALMSSILTAYAFAQLASKGSVIFGFHVACGVIAGLLLVWRVAWGFLGSKHAVFRSLAFGPSETKEYFLCVVRGKGNYYAGHNPGSAMAIWMMFVLIVVTLVSGVLAGLGGAIGEELHELAPNLLLAVVLFHVAGVLLATVMHRENYIGSMFTGRKTARPEEAISHSHPMAALVMVAWVAGGLSYFAGGFDFKGGTFSPPGTSISVPLVGGEQEAGHGEHERDRHRERREH